MPRWIVSCFAVFLLLFHGCQQPPPPITLFTQNVMTIDYHIQIGHPLNKKQKKRIQAIIQETFAEVNAIYNKWNPQSEISLLNALPAGQKQQLSPTLFQFLTRIDEMVRLTEGRFDPTVEPLMQLWKRYLQRGQEPPEQEIQDLKSCIGWNKIHFEDGLFYKEDSRSSLDLGGIAKGLCVDLLIERMNQLGFDNVYVEWGGEIRASGQHPTGRPWRVYITHFEDTRPEQAIAYVDLTNSALATSGNYFQFWSTNTKTYCHIFNPLTLSPVEVKPGAIASVSLQAPDCVTADAFAKIAMMFDSQQEAQIWVQQLQEQLPQLTFWIVTR